MNYLKILQTYPFFPPARGYGPIEIIYNISKLLAKRDHKIHIATTKFIKQRKKYLSLKGLETKESLIIHRFPSVSFGRYIMALSYIPFILSQNFDIIHIHGSRNFFADCTLFLKRLNLIKTPIVITSDGGIGSQDFAYNSYNYWYRALSNIQMLISGKNINFAEKVIAASKFEAFCLQNYGIKKSKMEIIPNGVDINKFNPKLSIINLDKNREHDFSKIILHVGRLAKVKGIHVLIRAFQRVVKEYKDIGLLLVGSDYGYKKELKKLVNKLDLENQVIFYGVIPENALLEVYKIADIVVIPSEIEMFGMVTVEAGSFEKPVIATNIGPIPEIIEDGYNGFLVSYGDYENLAEKIILLLKNPRLREEMGRNARKKVIKRYSWKNIVNRIERIYNELK